MDKKQMTRQTESERLYVVETKLDTVLTAVENTNSKIDTLSTSLEKYATRAELERAIVEKDLEIQQLKNADVQLAKRHVLSVWLTGLLASGLGVGMTILIQMAFD